MRTTIGRLMSTPAMSNADPIRKMATSTGQRTAGTITMSSAKGRKRISRWMTLGNTLHLSPPTGSMISTTIAAVMEKAMTPAMTPQMMIYVSRSGFMLEE